MEIGLWTAFLSTVLFSISPSLVMWIVIGMFVTQYAEHSVILFTEEQPVNASLIAICEV